ncbi:hypothetical protein GCM10025857_36160 [Alicyclobacillus contaminans]|uniref:DUF5348 domain-containing protein n=1 Tax=Alicyclobacillus contaminans TaxID=392016 RepID=UPI0005576994|nr:DUF5348 domain-containing protein [Alicyclobacillus contaminans]GMA52259.1 hypothetical protein GCM10025857_36160 [Alicyclobacillus contaminans]
MRRAVLRYVEEYDRWFANVGKQMTALHCGEGFQLHMGRRKVDCRIEMGRTWYVIMGDVPLALMKNKTYLISINI